MWNRSQSLSISCRDIVQVHLHMTPKAYQLLPTNCFILVLCLARYVWKLKPSSCYHTWLSCPLAMLHLRKFLMAKSQLLFISMTLPLCCVLSTINSLMYMLFPHSNSCIVDNFDGIQPPSSLKEPNFNLTY